MTDDELRDRLSRIESMLAALVDALAQDDGDEGVPVIDLDGNRHEAGTDEASPLS